MIGKYTGSVGTVVVVAAVGSVVLAGRPIDVLYDRWMLHNGPAAVVTLWMGRLILRRRAWHGAGLVLVAFGALSAAHVGVAAVVDARFAALGVDDLAAGATFVPAELPLDAAIPLWVMSWLWVPIPVLAMTMLLLVFPDGDLPPGRWRWAVTSAVAGTGLLMLAHGIVAWPGAALPISSVEVPVDQRPLTTALTLVGGLAVLASAVGAVGVLVRRWRHAEGLQRRPFRAVGTAGVVLAAVGTLTWPWQDVWRPAILVALLALLVTYALAAARYRLHDLDPLLSRTAVAAILAAGVTGAYLVIVVGAGALIGRRADSALLPLIAVGVVAVLFEPARRQARRLVDRLLYGRDTDRAGLLSQLAALTSTATRAEDVLVEVTELLVRSTGAGRAEVWLGVDGSAQLAAATGKEERDPTSITSPVVHHGEQLGEVRLSARHASDLLDDATLLLEDVAHSLGVVLRNARLTVDLRRRLDELHRSRQRLVEVHDEARRGLERDIHDGAQSQLIALRLRLGAARMLAEAGDTGALAQQLDEIGGDIDAAVRSLRELARGVYPPVLEQSGLVAALRAHARGLQLPVSVRSRSVGRYEPSTEAAVYFCCLEAIQNAGHHAGASQITVELDGRDGTLRFAVVDDGIGFDPDAPRQGTGLTNLEDRVMALGGEVEVCSSPGSGTRVRGQLPAHASVSER